MAQASSYAFASSPSNSAFEQWVKRDLRTRYNDALTEAVPADLLALVSTLAAPVPKPGPHLNGH